MSSKLSSRSPGKTQKTYSVRISGGESSRGRYLRFRTVSDSSGKTGLKEDFVGSFEDSSRYVRFEDAREKALEKKVKNPSLEVSVVEISGKALGKSHPVKCVKKDLQDAKGERREARG